MAPNPVKCPKCNSDLNYNIVDDSVICYNCRLSTSLQEWKNGNWSATTSSHSNPPQTTNPCLFAGTYQSYLALQQAAYQNSLAQQAAQQSPGLSQLGQLSYLRGRSQYDTIPKEPLKSAGITVGELIGYRIWRIQDGYLGSYSADHVWAPGHIMTGQPGDHDNVGIWAFKQPSRALKKMLEEPNSCFGSISMWGEVVEHADGYRAEFARIESVDDCNLTVGAPANRFERILWKRKNLYKTEILQTIRYLYGLSVE